MVEQETITLPYYEHKHIHSENGNLKVRCAEKECDIKANDIYAVEDRCKDDEGFKTVFKGFHNLIIKDDFGVIYGDFRENEQFAIMTNGKGECIVIWYPDTEARGSSYASAMLNAKEIYNL